MESGGKPAERIRNHFSILVSDTTLLRLINEAQTPDSGGFTVTGVDDWAYKKRERYGSILVDPATRRIVDLLPDTEEASLVNWLQKEPKLEIITRDRYGNYRRVAAKAAP